MTEHEGRPHGRDEEDFMLISLHPALVQPFRAWLDQRGMQLAQLPPGSWVEPQERPWIVIPKEVL